jgi:hypothetical protein
VVKSPTEPMLNGVHPEGSARRNYRTLKLNSGGRNSI